MRLEGFACICFVVFGGGFRNSVVSGLKQGVRAP